MRGFVGHSGLRWRDAPMGPAGPIAPGQGVRTMLWLWLACAVACGGRPLPFSEHPANAGMPNPEETSWDGGLLSSTPGQVRCGSRTCAHGYECCRELKNPASAMCLWRAAAECLEPTRWCDETADCNPGELCCVTEHSSLLIASCHSSFTPGAAATSCDSGEYLACASDEDCRPVSAARCVAQRCRGDVVQTCGRLPSAWCPP